MKPGNGSKEKLADIKNESKIGRDLAVTNNYRKSNYISKKVSLAKPNARIIGARNNNPVTFDNKIPSKSVNVSRPSTKKDSKPGNEIKGANVPS